MGEGMFAGTMGIVMLMMMMKGGMSSKKKMLMMLMMTGALGAGMLGGEDGGMGGILPLLLFM